LENNNKDILWRIRTVYAVIAVFALLILGKVLHIQFVEGEHWRNIALNATMRYVGIDAARGDIRSDDGRLLATSIPVYEIRMDLSNQVIPEPVFRASIDSLCISLSSLFGDRTPAQYRSELIAARKQQERYFLVKRNVGYNELIQLREFPIFRLGRYRGGFIVTERTRREMPYKTLAARTIGYEREGFYVGLEGAYREYLEGTQGKRLMQRTSGGNWMPINDENEIQPQNGMDIFTTLNVHMQDIAENALKNQLQKYNADYGTIVVMEVSTGKIKAISNLSLNSRGMYEEAFNFAVGESTEPGSTFKLASMIAILEDGIAKPGDFINTGNGQINYYDRVMRDAREGGFGNITLQEAFELSSNVGISKIIQDAYSKSPQRFINRLKAIGLDKPLGLEISGEGSPNIKDANSQGWSAVSLPWMAIGYELSLTPLQILSLFNAVANDGKMMRPMFVEEIRQTGSTVRTFSPTVLNRSIASNSTLQILQNMLLGVVENGTAKNIYTNRYKIAGKTGTAQVAQTRHGYMSDSGVIYQASFAGYFPADHPAYSMIVVIHNPKGWVYTGSQVAAPVFREVADKIFATHLVLPEIESTSSVMASLPLFKNAYKDDLRNIYAEFNAQMIDIQDSEWVSTAVASDTVTFRGKTIPENLVPDVTGMGLRDALYLMENTGIRVRFSGRGTVRRQSIPSGATVGSNQVIYLELN
jgi:cell division protein FtsI (penicillin-binding protein 3)